MVHAAALISWMKALKYCTPLFNLVISNRRPWKMDQEELLILNLTMEWVSQVYILLTRNRQLVNQNSSGI